MSFWRNILSGLHFKLFVILIAAVLLRVFALSWGLPDQHRPYTFHPDEQAGIVAISGLINDHLSPTYYAFSKGTGYFYSAAAAVSLARCAGWIRLHDDGKPADRTSHKQMILLARLVTVMFSVGTVLLTFLCGRLLFGEKAAIVAALIVAVSPISVVNAHFVKTDCAEAFWVTLTLYFAARSKLDWKWLPLAFLSAGAAGAFKYPGASSLIFAFAAIGLFLKGSRVLQLRALFFGLPLFVLGFVAFFPSVLLAPGVFIDSLSAEFGYKVGAGGGLSALYRVLVYPWYALKATGLILPLWSFAAVIYCIVRARRESWLLLLWLIPYGLLISSSSMLVTRYLVPMIPVMALLMAHMSLGLIDTYARRKKLISVITATGIVCIFLVTAFHLRTMMREDPRDSAGAWIRSNVLAGSAVAVTPTHDHDWFFVVPVNLDLYQVVRLDMRTAKDVSSYLDMSFDVLAANEKAWHISPKNHVSRKAFWEEISAFGEWRLAASFTNHPSWSGLLLRGKLPEDLYYLYHEARVYRR